jgi:hypothetical protein
MNFFERSYSSSTFRPKPHIVIEQNPFTLYVVTTWGSKDISEKISKRLSEVINSESMIGRPDRENVFIEAAVDSNKFLTNEINGKEYKTLVELTMISIIEGVAYWLQVGAPGIVVFSDGRGELISSSPDFSWQFNQTTPLPSIAMGVDLESRFQAGSFRMTTTSNIFLIARSFLNSSIYSLKNPDLSSVTKCLVSDSADLPFWIGQISG